MEQNPVSQEMAGKKRRKWLSLLGKMLLILVETVLLLAIALYGVMYILAKGPSPTARELFVRSVRETSAIGFLAEIYLSEEEIAQIEASAEVEEYEEVDTSLIQIVKPESDNSADGPVADAWGLVDEDGDGIIIDHVRGEGYVGYMMIVLDPSRGDGQMGRYEPHVTERIARRHEKLSARHAPQRIGGGKTCARVVRACGVVEHGVVCKLMLGIRARSDIARAADKGKIDIPCGIDDTEIALRAAKGIVLGHSSVPVRLAAGCRAQPRQIITALE